MESAPGLNLKPNLSSTSTMAARSEMGEATAAFVAAVDLADSGESDRGPGLSKIGVSVRGLVSDPPGVSLVTGVVLGSPPVSE